MKSEWVTLKEREGKIRGQKPMEFAVKIGSIRVVEDRAAMPREKS